jgi:hypothetical protein
MYLARRVPVPVPTLESHVAGGWFAAPDEGAPLSEAVTASGWPDVAGEVAAAGLAESLGAWGRIDPCSMDTSWSMPMCTCRC